MAVEQPREKQTEMEQGELSSTQKKRQIYRSLFHISAVFFLIYTPYRCLESIQSSLNFEDGLGALSLGVLQGGNFVSCVFLGAPFVYKFGPKWSLFISFFSHTIYIIVNCFPTWATIMPSSILSGVVSAMIWVSQGTYVTLLAQQYADCSSQDLSQILPKFSAIFHLFWGACSPVGNLLASLVFGFHEVELLEDCSTRDHGEVETKDSNHNFQAQTYNVSNDSKSNTSECAENVKNEVCGANYCPFMSKHLGVLEEPSRTLVYILMGIFLIFNVSGLILCWLLKPLDTPKNSTPAKKLLKIVTLVRKPDLVLMIVPFILIGMLPGMFYGSLAQSFVSCVFGIGMVGYAMMSEGIGFAVACLICGLLTRLIPRVIQLSLVFASIIAISVTWLFWTPSGDDFGVVIAMSVLYGVTHGLCRTHFSALTSQLFTDDPEPAFSHYHIGRTFGLCVTFAVSPYFCFAAKTYMLLTTVCVATLSYTCLEIRLHCKKDDKTDKFTDIKDNATSETMLDKPHKRITNLSNSMPGSLSGSCTNINLQS